MTLRPAEIFAALERHDVRYVAIGGTAVNAHGLPRATFDVDVTVAPEPANYERLAAALDVAGVRVRVAALDHLVSMKRSAGRPKDLQDLADLLREA